MSHSLVKIWIHLVYGTKNGTPLVHANIEKSVHNHIKDHLQTDFRCAVRAINGMPDHIHILFLLNPNYAIKDIVKNIKGESSHWINQENMCPTAFAWQTGYGAFSVSESIVEIVERYIDNQKEHHRKKLFAEEYHEFMMQYGISKTE